MPTLDDCLRRDQHRLRRERDRLSGQRLRGTEVAAAEEALQTRIAASAAARARRAASVPPLAYPEDLPVSQHREEIRRAIEQRLEKHARDPKRDAQLVAQLAPLETRHRERVKAERGARRPGNDEYRWLLEELRVSLFAQQLKTRMPVSARRLDQVWGAREASTPRT